VVCSGLQPAYNDANYLPTNAPGHIGSSPPTGISHRPDDPDIRDRGNHDMRNPGDMLVLTPSPETSLHTEGTRWSKTSRRHWVFRFSTARFLPTDDIQGQTSNITCPFHSGITWPTASKRSHAY